MSERSMDISDDTTSLTSEVTDVGHATADEHFIDGLAGH